MKSSVGSRLRLNSFGDPMSRAPSIVDLQGLLHRMSEYIPQLNIQTHLAVFLNHILLNSNTFVFCVIFKLILRSLRSLVTVSCIKC